MLRKITIAPDENVLIAFELLTIYNRDSLIDKEHITILTPEITTQFIQLNDRQNSFIGMLNHTAGTSTLVLNNVREIKIIDSFHIEIYMR